MKKILFCILFIFPMLVYCSFPLTVYADCDFESSFLSFPYPDGDKLYLQFHCHDRNDTEGFLFYFEVSDISDVLSSDFSDGVLSISLKSNTTLYQHYIDYNNDHFSRQYSFSEFSYDSNSKKFTCITGTSIWYLSDNYVVTDIDTNILDIHPKDIDVSIYPDLDYNFDYQVDFMGESVPINLLQLDITNNTDKPYQYAVLIQPEDGFLEFDDHSNSRNLSIFWGDSPVTYALIKDEWYYSPFAFGQGYELINAPCAWHFLGAKSFKREQIYFEQMQLKKGTNYTLKVLAFDLSDKSDPTVPWCTASALIDVVFTQNFSVTSDTIFNPDQDANGCYSYDNTIPLDTQFDKVKAVYNKDTGKVDVLENGQFGNVYKKNTTNGGSVYSSNSSSFSASTSFNNLLIYSSSYFVLCSCVLRYFPDWVVYCFYAALSGLVTIFILKKL